MKRRKAVVLVFVLSVVAAVASAGAEDQFGIEVYPGAQIDEETGRILSEGMQVNGAAYRTNDPAEKVIDFYKNQKELRAEYLDKSEALFKKGNNIDVTIQNPWMNVKTGKMMDGTLISIVHQK